MNKKIIVPDHIPAEHHEMYRAFTLAQSIQQLLADNGVSILESHNILGYVAIKCSTQLREPDAVVVIGQGFTDSYYHKTNRHCQLLLRDPAARLRLDALNQAARKLSCAADAKRAVAMNIEEGDFMAPQSAEPSRIVLPS